MSVGLGGESGERVASSDKYRSSRCLLRNL